MTATLLGAMVTLGVSLPASAQTFVMRRPVARIRSTGIFFRIGTVTSLLDPSGLEFRAQQSRAEREAMMTPMTFTGKALQWDYLAMPGLTLNVAVDARWFYIRAGADVYLNPEVPNRAIGYTVQHTTQGFISAGPRIAIGERWAFQAGLRVGAMFMNVYSREHRAEYSAIAGIGAVDVGLQWRPTRWFELDATVGQDVLTDLHVTTFGIAASFGYSRAR